MKYYRVKPEYDGYMIGNNIALIANELYTTSELLRFKIPIGCTNCVEIPKSKVYTSFGARFECRANNM